MIRPLPCPFCGSTKITVEWEHCPKLDQTDTVRRWFAECTQCSCQGPFCQKEPQVIPEWNKRATEQEREKKLRAALLMFVQVERSFGHNGQHKPEECADCKRQIIANEALGHGYLN